MSENDVMLELVRSGFAAQTALIGSVNTRIDDFREEALTRLAEVERQTSETNGRLHKVEQNSAAYDARLMVAEKYGRRRNDPPDVLAPTNEVVNIRVGPKGWKLLGWIAGAVSVVATWLWQHYESIAAAFHKTK